MGNEASTGNRKANTSSSTTPSVTLLKAPDGRRPESMSASKDDMADSMYAPDQRPSSWNVERVWAHGKGDSGEAAAPPGHRNLEVVNHRTITPIATSWGQQGQHRPPLPGALPPRAPERKASRESPSTSPPSNSPRQHSPSSFSASPPPQGNLPLGVIPPERRTTPANWGAIYVSNASKDACGRNDARAAPVAPERRTRPAPAPGSLNAITRDSGAGNAAVPPLSMDPGGGLTVAQNAFFSKSGRNLAEAQVMSEVKGGRQTPPRLSQVNQNVPPRGGGSPPVTEREGHGQYYASQLSPSNRSANVDWLDATKDPALDSEGVLTGRRSLKHVGSGSARPGSGYVSARSFASATYNDSGENDYSASMSPTNAAMTPTAVTPTVLTPRSNKNAQQLPARSGRSHDGSKTPTMPKRATEPGKGPVMVTKLSEEALSSHILRTPTHPVKYTGRLAMLPGHHNWDLWFQHCLQARHEEPLDTIGSYQDQIGWGDETISRVST